MIQAELKLKQTPALWSADQVDALKWAGSVFEKMDPHARDDIVKFQEKLEKIEKEIEKQNRMGLAANVEFYAIKEEYS